MRKKILLMLSIFAFATAGVFAQAIEGGAGVIHVDGDPNLMLTMDNLSLTEGHIAYDRDNRTVYFHNPAGIAFAVNTPAAGTQWTAIDVSNLVDPITSIVVDAAGSPELTATTVGGVTTLSFESDAAISYDAADNELVFTDVDGDESTVDFDLLEGIVDVQAGNTSITVTGEGSAADPYLISLTGASIAGNNGFVPVTDGTGTLTWTDVVQSITVNADGTIDVTTTSGTTAPLTLNGPKVENMTELNTAAGALNPGETGIAIADVNNTFGLTATSSVGVLFFISN